MRLFLFVPTLFLSLALTSVSAKTSETSSTNTKPVTKRLVVLGDSLTEGYGVSKEAAYPSILEKKIHDGGKREWSVVNAGITGSTTASAAGRMKWLFKTKPDMLLLALGANDGLRGIKLEESEKNLSKAIEFAQEQKVPVVLGGLYMPPNYGKDYTEKFKNMYLNVSKKYKVPLIPFILDKVAGDPKYNLSDGIHPNEAGHKIIGETVYQEIKGLL